MMPETCWANGLLINHNCCILGSVIAEDGGANTGVNVRLQKLEETRDFWGWDAHEARLRCPDDVSGDMQEDEIPGGA